MGFLYQLLIILAVLAALPFQKNWKDRGFLLATVIGTAVLVDGVLIAVSYVIVKNKLPLLGILDTLLLWLPVIIPAFAWYFAEQKIKSNYDFS